MAAAIAGAACPAVGDLTTIAGWESVATSYPGFADDLARLTDGRGRLDERRRAPASPPIRSSPSTGRPGPASPPCPGPWPTGWASTGWTPGPCTGRWPGPPSTGSLDPGDREAVAELARTLALTVGERVEVDGTDITEAIRGPEVSGAVSVVAANPACGRCWSSDSDSGWPNGGAGWSRAGTSARWSSPTPTSRSTSPPRPTSGPGGRPEEGADALARRDRLDSTRAVSPLGVADGARVIDTTDRQVEDIVDEVVAWL